MAKEFEVQLPDEPFKNTFDLNKKVTCTYTGPRYLAFRLEKISGQIVNVEATADNLSDIDLSIYTDTNYSYTVIDAYQHPLEISFITNWYTNEDYPDFEQELPTGEKYVYLYDANSVLHVTYATQLVYYSTEHQFFSKLELLKPAFTKEQFDQIVAQKIAWVEEVLKFNDEEPDLEDKLSPEKLKEVEDYLAWLKNIEINYSGVEHWKIPFPPAPNIG